MAKYTVIRSVSYAEECVVEANSEEEAIDAAIDYDNWQGSPNSELISDNYVAFIED